MLEIRGVNRSFSGRRVLHDVSFEVETGKLTGFVGANGAGKTTTMRIILGVLAADSGEVYFNGKQLDDSVRHRTGYMPEERGLYPKMRVAEQLSYLAQLHGLTPERARSNAQALIERLGLDDKADKTIESLSLGNQQRAQIAASLVHDPEILVLDEPFSGLDPIAVENVQGVLKSRAAEGIPVLFSSHQLDIVERLCDNLVVIADGRIRAAGSREALRSEFGSSNWELISDLDPARVKSNPGLEIVSAEGRSLVFKANAEMAQEVLKQATALGAVDRFTPVEPTLAEIFREVIE
ncbi:MAG: ATP-binding cassette domain-containing protein [Homoserinimonas sp.]|nr:ATP-binding cassette domain-containing protein [Homoserinimonas sp.]MCW5944292.1 ATP-binding cassette domain-containing protein [Cryobacterium sp.]